VIGKGSFGCVSRGKCKISGRPVALKVMKGMKEKTGREYDIIKILREI